MRIGLIAFAGLLMSGAAAQAASVSPEVIFGSGNDNGSFTVAKGTYGTEHFTDLPPVVELGLRGKLRFNESNLPENTFNYDGVDTYTFKAGAAPIGFGPATPVWNFEWSINSDSEFDGPPIPGASSLNALEYQLRIDGDPGIATDFAIFDPINVAFADHAIGTFDTGNGGGTKATDDGHYASLIQNNQVAQNSWNYLFFNSLFSELAGFDPNVAGLYRIELAAFEDINGTLRLVAETGINIRVAAVPLPAAAPLLLGGLALVGFMGRRRKAQSV